MISEEIIISNYAKYKKYLTNIIGEEAFEKLINNLGGEEKVMKATYGSSADSGLAFDGSAIQAMLEIAQLATSFNSHLPEGKKVDNKEIYKVVLIANLSKSLMFEPNDNSWEIEKRGIIYKFSQTEGALRTGERSALIALNSGITLTPTEFEAIRIIDKSDDDDKYSKFFSSTLSVLVKSATEIYNNINKKS